MTLQFLKRQDQLVWFQCLVSVGSLIKEATRLNVYVSGHCQCHFSIILCMQWSMSWQEKKQESGPLQIRWKLLKHDDNAAYPRLKFCFQQTRNRTLSGVALPTDLYLIAFTFNYVCQCLACICVYKHSFWSECVSVWPFLKWQHSFPYFSFCLQPLKVGIPLKPFLALGRLLIQM